MVRRLAKALVARALAATGSVRAAGAWTSGGRGPLVLAYHRVVEDFESSAPRTLPAMLISRRTLERHLDWIGRHFTFVSLDEIGARLFASPSGRKPIAAVTFDDGYRDTYLHALPLLERKGIPGAVFAVADLVGTGRLQRHDSLFLALRRALSSWRRPAASLAATLRRHGATREQAHRLARRARDARVLTPAILEAFRGGDVDELIASLTGEFGEPAGSRDELLPLDWPMLADIVRRGMIVGSHTATHPLLTLEDGPVVRAEVVASRIRLERGLGIAIRHFAYPGGRFDAAAVEAVAAAGYRFAYTTCAHRDPRRPELTVSRRVLWERSAIGAWGDFSPAMLSCQVEGVFDVLPRCRHAREREGGRLASTGLCGLARGAR